MLENNMQKTNIALTFYQNIYLDIKLSLHTGVLIGNLLKKNPQMFAHGLI